MADLLSKRYSIMEYTYTGGSRIFDAPFALGILDVDHVRVYVRGENDGLGEQIYRNFTWNSGVVTVTDPIIPDPVLGYAIVVLERTVPKEELFVSFTSGADVSRTNLDRMLTYTLMALHESLDGRFDSRDAIEALYYSIVQMAIDVTQHRDHVDDVAEQVDADKVDSGIAAIAAELAQSIAEQAASDASDSADTALNAEDAAEAAQDIAEGAAFAAAQSAGAAEDAQDAAELAQLAAEAAQAIAESAAGPLIGGSTGQLLSKKSGADYDYEWRTVAGTGDMQAADYDPDFKAANVYDMDNMEDGAAQVAMTVAERAAVAGAVRFDQAQSLTSGQKQQARSNIAGIGYSEDSGKTDAEKATARSNIDAPWTPDTGGFGSPSSAGTYTLPAGGRYFWFRLTVSTTGGMAGPIAAGVSPGGTQIASTGGNVYHIVWWRIA